MCKVFCSVPDLKGVMQEVKRVLKPGGKLLHWDHVYADDSRKLLRLGQNVLNPLQQALADGCHLNRYPSDKPYVATCARSGRSLCIHHKIQLDDQVRCTMFLWLKMVDQRNVSNRRSGVSSCKPVELLLCNAVGVMQGSLAIHQASRICN